MRRSVEYRYSLYGLVLSSQIECPQLYAYSGDGVPDVIIEKGVVPDITCPGKREGFLFEAVEHAVMIKTNTIARLLVSDGRHILVQPYTDSSEDDVRMLLLGWGMGALLHQQSVLPLHAAVVTAVEGFCIAFCGDSGTGKSTLAAALLRRGCRLLDDNLSAIVMSGGALHVLPGCPEVKLTKQALGLWPQDWIMDMPFLPCGDKTGLFMQKHFEHNTQPLGAVFMLSMGGSSAGRIRRLRGAEAFHLLHHHIFCRQFLAGMGQPARHFETILHIVNEIPFFSLELSKSKPHPDRLAEMIEELLTREICVKSTLKP